MLRKYLLDCSSSLAIISLVQAHKYEWFGKGSAQEKYLIGYDVKEAT
jgi:hypothetical protein